jgi:hypothetical protein
MDVMVRHKNADWYSGEKDQTAHLQNENWVNDDYLFTVWRQQEYISTANRVIALMESKGVKTSAPDLSGRRVMIATPSSSAQYDRLYLNGLMNTFQFLRQFGANVVLSELPGCSDISLAREKLFGTFLRSNSTDCVWIDDDMGWKPEAVLQLLQANRDFVAVAGPRKVFPPSFAVSVDDGEGNATKIELDAKTGFVKDVLVGMAFCSISHHCAVRMAQMYKDMEYIGADGRTEIAVFQPMIVNKRRLSEDFAFCYRWRKIGGETLVASHITLEHTGRHVWSGNWLDHLVNKIQEEKAQSNREAA